MRIFGPDVLIKNLPLPKRLLSIRGYASPTVCIREPRYITCVVSAQLAMITEIGTRDLGNQWGDKAATMQWGRCSGDGAQVRSLDFSRANIILKHNQRVTYFRPFVFLNLNAIEIAIIIVYLIIPTFSLHLSLLWWLLCLFRLCGWTFPLDILSVIFFVERWSCIR